MGKLFHVRCTLKDLPIAVVRELLIPEDYSLYEVHLCIQVALGWDDMASFEFVRSGLTVGVEPSFAGEGITHDGHRYRHADEITLRQLIGQVGHRATYTYDFERLWGAELRLLAKTEQESELPGATGADGLAPPEALAHKGSFGLLLDAFADPTHELHAVALAQLGEDFEMTVPETEEITEALLDLFADAIDPLTASQDDEDGDDDWGWWDPSKYDDKMRLRVLQEELGETLFGRVSGGSASERQSSLLDALRGKRLN